MHQHSIVRCCRSPIDDHHHGQPYEAAGAGFSVTRSTPDFCLPLEYGWYSGGERSTADLGLTLDAGWYYGGYNRLIYLVYILFMVDTITILEHPTSLSIPVSLSEMVCFMEGHAQLQISVSLFSDMLELHWIMGRHACISPMSLVLGRRPWDTLTKLQLIVGMQSLCGLLRYWMLDTRQHHHCGWICW